ncbi:MAG TPA: N-acetylmuramoyl-L-alanine amidase, partial [bacterium]|nr:N-acetylmuramoyl-L-alanine amidase [bacterium]
LNLEALNRFYLNFLINKKIDFKGIAFFVRTNNLEAYQHILKFLPVLPPVPKKEGESAPQTKSLVPEKKYGNIEGGLTGKTIFTSPGHGWVYDTDNGTWNTQRGINLGMREDDSNAEIVSYFLVPYLQNAGALVFSARETDRNESMVIVDDADGSSFPESGTYEEGGSWTETTSGKGYGRTAFPIEIENNVMENGKYRYATAGTGAWAKWTPNIPEDGNYHVYVSYKTFTDRAPDAVYTVNHAGGETEVTVSQKHHGSTWVDLGQFYFKKGTGGSVTLNKSDDAESGTIIIADAVRIGGGNAILKRGTSTSGKPRWEEAAKVHAQFLGAPSTVYQSSVNDRSADVTARSRWTAWENEAGVDDSIYISWHSNAFNGSSRGISTYIYSSDEPGSTYVTTEAQAGSVELGELVHNRILNAVKSLFDSSWKQIGNGMYSAYFGELNPTYNNEMPACLVELAFHDNELDAAMLKNPKFRNIAARAAYQAIVKYFADRDDYDPVYLPSHPRNLRTETNDDGSVTLFWDEPESDENFYLGHPADGYLVQMSTDGKSFDTGTDVGNVTQFTVEDPQPGQPLYFRIIAYNDGGVSFPSVVAGAVPQKTGAQILIVDGFERVDQNTPRFAVGTNGSNRYMLEFINSYNYVIHYLEVFEELGFSADFTQKTNIGSIDLSKYDAVIWFAGEQSSNDTTFSISEQGYIAQYISDGGSFFVSGSEIGWDLVEKGNSADITFFNDVLNTDYINDSSNLYTFKGTGDFSTISGLFDDGTYIYQPNFPDVIEPFNSNGESFLFYDNDETLGAGVITIDTKKVAILGFPFETILEKNMKTGLMEKVFEKFEITPKEIPDDEEPDDGEELDDGEDSDDSDDSDQSDQSEMSDQSEVSDQSEMSDESEMSDCPETTDNIETSDYAENSDVSETIDETQISDDDGDFIKQDGCGCIIVGL